MKLAGNQQKSWHIAEMENRTLTINRNIVTCFACRGTGQEAHYASDGSDFLGPRECGQCKGSGWLRARDRRGRFASAKDAA